MRPLLRILIGLPLAGAVLAAAYGTLLYAAIAWQRSRIEADTLAPPDPDIPQLFPADADAGRWKLSSRDPVRDFDRNAAGWALRLPTGSEKEPAVVPAVERQGRAVRIPVQFPKTSSLFKRDTRVGPYRYFSYDIYVPPGAPEHAHIYSLFWVADKDGYWYQAQSPRLRPGQWNTVRVDLRGSAVPMASGLAPVGHHRPWTAERCTEVTDIGIQFYADLAWRGALLLDNLRAWSLEPRKASGMVVLGARSHAESGDHRPLAITQLRLNDTRFRQYDQVEVSFDLNREFSDPYDPEQVRVDAVFTSPSGRKMQVPGFYYQEYRRSRRGAFEQLTPQGRPAWKVRFTPQEQGEHRFVLQVTIDGGPPVKTAPRSFAVEEGSHAGFVRVADDKRHFVCDDGSMYYPIGHNFRSPTDLRCSQILGREHAIDQGTYIYERRLKQMADAGENLLEVWMCSWWVGLEWTAEWKDYKGVGRYNQANAWRLDWLLQEARRHGIRVHLVIDNHGKYSTRVDPEWEDSPYRQGNAPVGGWQRLNEAKTLETRRGREEWRGLNRPEDFFTDPTARQLYRRRLRYIMARWGHDPTIMGWEMVSELNLTTNGRFAKGPQMHAWHRDMIDYIHEELNPYDVLVTTHYSGDYNQTDPKMVGMPQIDYVVGDGYRRKGLFVDTAVRTAASWARYEKPFMITEFGGYWNGASLERLEADLHAGIWSSWATGASGAPLFWWFDLLEQEGWYRHYRAFANYIAGEDRTGHVPKPLVLQVTGQTERDVRGIGVRAGDDADLWVFDAEASVEMPEQPIRLSGISASVSGVEAGRYRVEYWDTYAGLIIKTEPVDMAERGRLDLQLPPFDNDVAIKIRRE